MPKLNRDQMITWLVNNDLDYVRGDGGGPDWLRWVLTTGFEGYENQTDAVLEQEIKEREEDAIDFQEATE